MRNLNWIGKGWVLTGLALLLGAPTALAKTERPTMDLNGVWQFQLDPTDQGETGCWYSQETSLTNTIRVPGCWQAQGFGEPLGILRHSYCGPAWYRRVVGIPKRWEDKAIILHVGAAFRQVQLFVNGTRAGEHDGFCTGSQFDITAQVKPGAANVIALRVTNPGQVITNTPGQQVPYAPTGTINYLGNWGGLFGNVWLEAVDQLAIARTHVTPDVQGERAAFQIIVQDRRSTHTPARLCLEVNGARRGSAYRATRELSASDSGPQTVELTVAMPGAELWTPDTPHLYTARISLESDGRECDAVTERFGMREITTRGDVLLLNGKPFFLRGYGDDSVWVRQGVPPVSREYYVKELRLTKSYGFNAIRFHSSVPVREVFEAADEVGMLLMAELPAAYAQYFMPFTNFYRAELTRVLDVYHNHPSFLSLALGDELMPRGNAQEKRAYAETIAEFYHYAKGLDPRRLILSNDGNRLPPSDMESARERLLVQKGSLNIPFIAHEFGGYYCSLPDVSLEDRFDGVINPAWLVPKRQWLRTNGLATAYASYLRNSQRLLNVGRKYQIEMARRIPNLSGYEYWLITDFPGGAGEGDSWEEGWFDYFWQPKRVTPEQGRQLNSPVLLMLEPGVTEATLWNDAPKDFQVWVSNYGSEELRDSVLRWKLRSGSRLLAQSQCSSINVGLGKVAQVASLQIPAGGGTKARKLELSLELEVGKERYLNSWNLWSFPRPSGRDLPEKRITADFTADWLSRLYPSIHQGENQGDLLLTSALTPGIMRFLQEGGSVFLLAGTNRTDRKATGQLFPASGGAQGTFIPRHPALRDFPHDGFCDLQFYHLITGSCFYTLDGAPQELVPLVGGLRTAASWLSKQKDLSRFGYVFEVRVGRGKLLVCSLRLGEGISEGRPEALFLFDQLLRYAAGKHFNPGIEPNPALLARLQSP